MTPLDTPTALAAVDDALASGRATAEAAEERELQELALALEADMPEPDPEFEAELGRLVAEGFPRRLPGALGRAAGWRPHVPALIRRLPRPRGRTPLAAGAAASVLLATLVAVAISTDEGARDGRSDATTPAAPAELDEAPSAERALGDPDVGVEPPIIPPPGGGGIAPGEDQRRIERSASIRLAAPGDELEQVADGIADVADRRRGFVLRSSVSTGDEGPEGGSFELRVPAASLQQTLRDLDALADVRSRSQSGDDITPAYVSTRDRLTAARAERRSLLRRLRRAEDDDRAADLRDRVLSLSAEIRGLRGELRRLRERTNYAAVSVELERKDGDAGEDGDGAGLGGSTGDAVDDALGTLVGSLNLALRVLGVLVPLALLGALGWLALGLMRRRRREAALS